MLDSILTRIDNRLVHGQVATQWCSTIGANLILVANDEVAGNKMLQGLMAGLSAAGGMIRFVGFTTMLRIMLSNDHGCIYFTGFIMATIIGYIPELAGSALLLIAFVGIALTLSDFQNGVAIKNAAGNGNGGDNNGI